MARSFINYFIQACLLFTRHHARHGIVNDEQNTHYIPMIHNKHVDYVIQILYIITLCVSVSCNFLCDFSYVKFYLFCLISFAYLMNGGLKFMTFIESWWIFTS